MVVGRQSGHFSYSAVHGLQQQTILCLRSSAYLLLVIFLPQNSSLHLQTLPRLGCAVQCFEVLHCSQSFLCSKFCDVGIVLQPRLPNLYMMSNQQMQNKRFISRGTHRNGKNMTFKKCLKEKKLEDMKKV